MDLKSPFQYFHPDLQYQVQGSEKRSHSPLSLNYSGELNFFMHSARYSVLVLYNRTHAVQKIHSRGITLIFADIIKETVCAGLRSAGTNVMQSIVRYGGR